MSDKVKRHGQGQKRTEGLQHIKQSCLDEQLVFLLLRLWWRFWLYNQSPVAISLAVNIARGRTEHLVFELPSLRGLFVGKSREGFRRVLGRFLTAFKV
jgi:hypothetical protein